ncbi:FprA family A-type flavoprotein [Alkaliphilus hydrothermalis]|uniref:Flavorubredoxin n=1 Tax=Alkaliphilus hydrothermalis TaxID=1482730 RepID=A0ABS2NPI3_9FIRM|nr:FprA family A-type flavoprotein [Alkaliphilus hydrothermalis]MBM7614858.1 flavorubredoxin [Alkaliphilus hydrothermalis]
MPTVPIKIKEDLHWIGMIDKDLRIFDVIMKTEYGTGYNSYLLKGSEKVAIFENVKYKYFSDYLSMIKTLTPIEKIDYVVVNHTEPDHSGSLQELLKLNPNITVVGTKPALRFLHQIINFPFREMEVKEGDSISLGNKTVRFIEAPFLHWPDSMYSYVEEDNTLISCDSFGCHYASHEIFNDQLEKDPLKYADLQSAYEYYYEMIMGPFRPYVLKALDKIEPLKIDVVCPGHGPILRENIDYYLNLYRQWSRATKIEDGLKRVTISYVSAYGYTQQIAEEIEKGIKSLGDFEVYIYDILHSRDEDILGKIFYSDGLLFGSPTIAADALKPVYDILSQVNPLVHGGKTAAAFGSYGWSGEATKNIEGRLQQLRMKIEPALKINFKPSDGQLAEAYQYGVEFGKKLLQN